MGKYDELVKPMKHRAAVVKDSLENIVSFSSSMTGQNLVNTLCEAFETVIRSNEEILVEKMLNQRKNQPQKEENCFSKDEVECLEVVATTADQNLAHLKNMLQMSDGVCISNFINSEKSLETSISDQRDELKKHACLEWTPSLNDIVMHAVSNAMSLVKIPQIQNATLTEVVLNAEEIERLEKTVDWKTLESKTVEDVKDSDFGVSSEVFQLRVDSEKVRLGILKQKVRKRVSVTSNAENVKDEFAKYWSVYFCSFTNCLAESVFRVRDRIAFFMKDTRDVNVYCVDTGNLLRAYKLPKNLEPLKFRLLSNRNSFFLVWNSEKLRIEFCHLSPDKGYLAMSEKPELLNSYKETYVFVDKQCNLTVYEKTNKIQLQISRLQHGLFHVDNILFENSNIFRMFDYKFMTSVKCVVDLTKTGSANRFHVESITKFKLPNPIEPYADYMGVIDDMYYVIVGKKFFSAGLCISK